MLSSDISGAFNSLFRSNFRRCNAEFYLPHFPRSYSSRRGELKFFLAFSLNYHNGGLWRGSFQSQFVPLSKKGQSDNFMAEETILEKRSSVVDGGIDTGIDKEPDYKYLNDDKMFNVCHKLIEVFMVDKPTPTDWRRLLIFSKQWGVIRPHFFIHCQKKADSESNPEKKQKLFRLIRKLKEIDDDMQKHGELINELRGSPTEISSIVAKRRKDFTKEFFVHFHAVAESYYDNPIVQNDFAKMGNDLLNAVQSYDCASENNQAVAAAEIRLKDIINSPSVAAACKKIDDLAEKKQLDSALVLMLTKAWSAAKESTMVKDEAKDVLFHLYKTAVGNMQRFVPKEVRILKYILTIDDPEEQLSALKDGFSPGVELEGMDVDCLYTTPERLHTLIITVMGAYHFSREGTLIREARDLMSPKVIEKLENLNKLVQQHFL